MEWPALTPRPKARGADPWGQCGLPRAGRLGSRQGASCEVPGAGPGAGTEEHVDEHQPGKEGEQLGPQPRTPPCSLSLQSPHRAHPQALRAPRITAGEPAPRGQAGLQGPGGWPPPGSRVASSLPPQSPSAQRTDESGAPGTQGSPMCRGAEGNVHRRHAEASRGLEPAELGEATLLSLVY